MESWQNFTLEHELGRGATARVVAATRKSDGLRVALKIFHPAFWDQDKLRRRAYSEFRAISSLQHPNIVRIIDAHLDYDPPGVVLEYVEGASGDASLESFQPRLPYILPEVSVLIVLKVLEALEHAHANGVIHRDLKPANILLSSDGRVVVSDFGMAKMSDMSRLTLSGTVLGSPDYMSPEQARGESATEKSDLFATAAVLYYLVTGTRPFSRHTPLATLAAVCNVELEPAQRRNPKLSPGLARILAVGLSRDARDRFESAAAFRKALEDYLAEIGLVDVSFGAWLDSPNDFSLDALRAISDRLVARAEAAIGSGDWEGTLEQLAHLSLVAPESAALVRLTQEFKSNRARAQRRRYLVPLLLLLIFLTGTGVVYGVRELRRPSAATLTATRPLPIAAASPSATTVAAQPQDSPAEIVPPPQLPVSAVRKKAPPTGTVRFEVPDTVRVYWDGSRIDSHHSYHEHVGTHSLRLERPGAPAIEQEIEVESKEPTVIQVH